MTLAADKIKPGSTVTVTITKAPSNEAAVKTLRRILAKDTQAAASIRREKTIRKRVSTTRIRAGRPWPVVRGSIRPFLGEVGETGTLLATIDVIRDLASVERFVEIVEAK